VFSTTASLPHYIGRREKLCFLKKLPNPAWQKRIKHPFYAWSFTLVQRCGKL